MLNKRAALLFICSRQLPVCLLRTARLKYLRNELTKLTASVLLLFYTQTHTRKFSLVKFLVLKFSVGIWNTCAERSKQ